MKINKEHANAAFLLFAVTILPISLALYFHGFRIGILTGCLVLIYVKLLASCAEATTALCAAMEHAELNDRQALANVHLRIKINIPVIVYMVLINFVAGFKILIGMLGLLILMMYGISLSNKVLKASQIRG